MPHEHHRTRRALPLLLLAPLFLGAGNGAPQPAAAKPIAVAEVAKAEPKAATEVAKVERKEQPPSLTMPALCEELRQGGAARRGEQDKLAAERIVVEREQARLSKLASEIAAARESLKKETGRLESLLEKAGQAQAEAVKAKPSRAPGQPEDKATTLRMDALAKTIKGMKPEQAAVLVTGFDRALAADLLRRMKPADVAAVLEKLKPALAVALVSSIAKGEVGP